jgi:hypothetical protein
MSSSKIVMTMAMLILIFLFGGLMLGFILQSEGVLEKQSGRVVINDEATMAQLITHVSLRAYNCNDQGGGQFSVADAVSFVPYVDGYKRWHSWKKYVEFAEGTGRHEPRGSDNFLSFQNLKDSTPGKIQCSGTSSTLPFQDKSLLQGAANLVTDSHWGNDQEGRYGRMEFKVNKTIWLGGKTDSGYVRGCYGFDRDPEDGNKLTDMTIFITGPQNYNYFQWDWDATDFTCHQIGDPSYTNEVEITGDPQKGTFLTVNVLYKGDPTDAFKDHRSDLGHQPVSTAEGNTDVTKKAFKVCEGATGYVQANTGGLQAALGDANDISGVESDGYSALDPPGKHGEQVGGNAGTDNQVRPFIVIRDAGDC